MHKYKYNVIVNNIKYSVNVEICNDNEKKRRIDTSRVNIFDLEGFISFNFGQKH